MRNPAPAATVTPAPDLADYDVCLVNSSAGKDSQAMLDVVVAAARAAGVLDRVVVVHADLGEAEWPGTAELAAEHAAHYGLRFEIVARRRDGRVETILERVAARGMFPDAARRWCTSDHKRGPVRTLMTRLAAEQRAAGLVERPVRLLNVLGLRAAESSARRSRLPYAVDRPASNGRRHVDTWLPIHTWSTAEVWQRIQRAGTRPHPAYAVGMSRLSCRFCVLASRADLICSARHNPDLAAAYAAVEQHTGHRFRQDLSMGEILAAAAAPDEPDRRAEQIALFPAQF
ncbi:phosphoadenosine phosphosulfate reductase family protein [Nocardia puris]|uniref:phosphoadenosine phosphosulfate reductase domain-containing protein n=1 Tax=Nocardia puris TaxID=208602 RepID=UPI0018946455|nr:phosphoadenosine phosphosulfate reductase family protein [Nocardia puris]MBF6216118.1 phosphoadenosine phosphosulfate reductase family protein [Nocardia puris]